MYFVNGEADIHGRKTDELTKAYAAEHKVSYSDALRAVVRNQQSVSRKYAEEGPTPGHNIQILGSIISGLPKQADGSIDPVAATAVINGSRDYLEIARASAGEYLSNLAQRLVGSASPVENVTYADGLRVSMRDNPAVSALYNGGRCTVEALKGILWTKFKYNQTDWGKLYSSEARTMVKTYSSDHPHIRYDANGNEYRRYEYTPTK